MIRSACVDDAVDATEVVRRSISELCKADHQDDPATLDRWLINKTPEKFKEWVSNPENFCVIAGDGARVFGVGLLKRSGEVLLFYVAPGYQRLGIGHRIHDALEAQAISWGLGRMYLESTALACNFYRSLGYQSTGPERSLFGVLRVHPLSKVL